jgi:hypothetical protein
MSDALQLLADLEVQVAAHHSRLQRLGVVLTRLAELAMRKCEVSLALKGRSAAVSFTLLRPVGGNSSDQLAGRFNLSLKEEELV